MKYLEYYLPLNLRYGKLIWPSAGELILIFLCYMLLQGYSITLIKSNYNLGTIPIEAYIWYLIIDYIAIPNIAYVLAWKGEYPRPFLWAFFAYLLIPAISFWIIIYLIFRTPYNKRVDKS